VNTSRDNLATKIKIHVDEVARMLRILRGEIEALTNYDNAKDTITHREKNSHV